MRETLGRLGRAGRGRDSAPMGRRPALLEPCCPFGALQDQRIDALEGTLKELRGRVNGLLFLMAGAVLVQLVLRILGV